MIVETILVLILALFYYWYGISYAKGSAEYAKANNNTLLESNEGWASVRDEYIEFVQAIKKVNIYDIFLEFFDVIHSVIKYLIIVYLPQRFYHNWICWAIVFPFVLLAGIKLGDRYNKFGCIRNHARPNLNHKCKFNDKFAK